MAIRAPLTGSLPNIPIRYLLQREMLKNPICYAMISVLNLLCLLHHELISFFDVLISTPGASVLVVCKPISGRGKDLIHRSRTIKTATANSKNNAAHHKNTTLKL
jgi:hypothetical protein